MGGVKLAVVMALAIGVIALSAHTAHAGLSDEALDTMLGTNLYADASDEPLASTQKQRALLAPTTYAPGYCFNSHIAPVFTAKIAILTIGASKGYVKGYKGHYKDRKGGKIYPSDYVALVIPRIEKRLARYNRRYRLNLGYKLTQLSSGFVKKYQQKWFFYDITFIVGTCGQYKFPLITQLRGEIQPSAPFIKRVRLLSYPFRK